MVHRGLRRLLAGCVVSLAAAGPVPGAAQSNPLAAGGQEARLEIRGDDLPSRVFTEAELAALPCVEVRATDHGREGTFSGVPLDTLLRRTGVPVDSVRGRRTADYVLVLAADGYRAVFSLAELAPDLGGRSVLLADHRDGEPLSAEEGPLRLVVPGDARAARWVRPVTTLVVRHASP